jgi:hypothetical protein
MRNLGSAQRLAVILVALVLVSSCKKNPVGPKPPAPPDTTSHNFAWQTFTLGDGSSSYLDGVAIINDTLIYAVGGMYLKDSTGQYDPIPYNLAKWNGHEWVLQRLYYQNFPSEIRSIFAISESDVWLDPWFHWDGHQFTDFPIDPVLMGVGVHKMWGSPGVLYVVGDGGFIASYTGTWQKIASNTTYNMLNIWGAGETVCCVTSQSKILTIRGNSVQDTLNWTGGVFGGIWFGNNTPMYVAGPGVWTNNGSGWTQINGLPSYYYTGIQGIAQNDLFTMAWGGVAIHYNGSTWHQYTEVANGLWDFEGLSVKNGMVAIVGEEGIPGGGRAVAVIGRRIK